MLEQYAMPGVSTNIEPELARRLQRILDHFGGRVMIESGYRSKAQQQALYAAWLASGKTNPPSVAVPGTSKHERDPAEATDLHRTDPSLTWGEVHYTAHAFGLWFPIAREDWHTECLPDWTDPTPSEADMTKEEFADAIGARIAQDGPFVGQVCVPLIDDNLTTSTLYPLAAAIAYTHQEMKTKRIRG